MIPYELEKGMDGIKQVLGRLAPGQQIAVFIGPEGGFDEEEIKLALKMGVKSVSLGKRILRTETAGPAIPVSYTHLDVYKRQHYDTG